MFLVFLVVGAIVFGLFLNKTFIHFVHSCSLFYVVRCLTPWPLVHLHRLVHLRRVGECVGLTSVALGKVLLCHTLRSIAPTPSPSEMRHVLVLACTCGGKKTVKVESS